MRPWVAWVGPSSQEAKSREEVQAPLPGSRPGSHLGLPRAPLGMGSAAGEAVPRH